MVEAFVRLPDQFEFGVKKEVPDGFQFYGQQSSE
jgi:hypothetical protein